MEAVKPRNQARREQKIGIDFDYSIGGDFNRRGQAA